MISAIVMASGFSIRMGKNKLLMQYNDKTIIENTLDILNKYDFKEVIVVSQYQEILKIANTYGFKAILNQNAILGQSESIKLGIMNSQECEGYMFFVGDQPLLNISDVKNIIKYFENNKEYIIIPTYKETKGNPVIFPSSLKDSLLMLKNDEKGKKVINEYDKIKYVKVNKETLMDIDTKKDYDDLINI